MEKRMKVILTEDDVKKIYSDAAFHGTNFEGDLAPVMPGIMYRFAVFIANHVEAKQREQMAKHVELRDKIVAAIQGELTTVEQGVINSEQLADAALLVVLDHIKWQCEAIKSKIDRCLATTIKT
jgi:enamine deaminase RidA (YjgF/YER057c/UK114 family)